MLLERRAVVDPRIVAEHLVAVLQCGQCVVEWWRSDGFDAREGVGDNFVLSRIVPYVCRELGDKV
jgi:hypothetical protein